jgi:hypothetical protein
MIPRASSAPALFRQIRAERRVPVALLASDEGVLRERQRRAGAAPTGAGECSRDADRDVQPVASAAGDVALSCGEGTVAAGRPAAV